METPNKEVPEGNEHAVRIRQARKVLRTLGHIDFTTRETGTFPPLIQRGVKEDGSPATPESWIEMYRASYGYNPEYDDVADIQSEEEFADNAIRHAQWAFGPDAPPPGAPNAELLKGILSVLGKNAISETSDTTSEIENADPLVGTQFESIPNEELWRGQTVFGEDGKQHHPEEGDEYRKAFLYYAKVTGIL